MDRGEIARRWGEIEAAYPELRATADRATVTRRWTDSLGMLAHDEEGRLVRIKGDGETLLHHGEGFVERYRFRGPGRLAEVTRESYEGERLARVGLADDDGEWRAEQYRYDEGGRLVRAERTWSSGERQTDVFEWDPEGLLAIRRISEHPDRVLWRR